MAILLFCVSRNTRRIDFPLVDGLSTDTPDLGRHKKNQHACLFHALVPSDIVIDISLMYRYIDDFGLFFLIFP